MAVVGNTVMINCVFPNTIPNLDNMIDVKVNIYLGNVIIYTIQDTTKISTGVYTANYTVSNREYLTPLVVEFVGVVDGYNYVGRTQLNRTMS